MSSNQAMIEVESLTVRYGDMTAVDNISFEVAAGRSMGILGSNGAGKSSTLRVLAGVNPPTDGKARIAGYEVTHPRQVDLARSVTGYCPDVGGLIKTATIREHIGVTLALHNKLHLWSPALEMVDRFELMDFLDVPTSGFSHGMSRRLSVILAALSSTNALILDEPFDGVDPTGVDITMSIINEAKESGLAVVISTHLQELLVRASDDIIVMKGGKIRESGLADKFKGEQGKTLYRSILDNGVEAKTGGTLLSPNKIDDSLSTTVELSSSS